MGMCFFFSAGGLVVAPSPSFQAGLGGWVYFMSWLEVKGGLVEFVTDVDLCLKPWRRGVYIAEERVNDFLR